MSSQFEETSNINPPELQTLENIMRTYERSQKQIEEGKTRLVKEVVKGDWQCRLCEYSKVCYEENEPRPLTLSAYL